VSKFVARAKVIATAAVTYLVLAGAVLAILAEELAKVLPDGPGQVVARVLGIALAAIGAAIAIIRRVTPVLDASEHGILPEDGGA
jgi:small neutral amino acid transporter SnatA (MarC family)